MFSVEGNSWSAECYLRIVDRCLVGVIDLQLTMEKLFFMSHLEMKTRSKAGHCVGSSHEFCVSHR